MKEYELTQGRPRGGTAILYHSNINAKIERVETDSDRLTAIVATIDAVSILLISVYMPWDEQREGDNLEEFIGVLNVIKNICLACDTNYIIIGGDLNCDLNRNDPQTQALKSFIEDEHLYLAINHPMANVSHTHESLSTIDHFIVTPNLADYITNYESLHTVQNPSDHSPLLLQMNLDIKYLTTKFRINSPSISWSKSTKDQLYRYQMEIDKQIDLIELDFEPFGCMDVKCKLHTDQINKWYSEIVRILLNASQNTLQMTGKKQKPKTVPGWNEYVKPKLETSLLWHNYWKECGRPRNGEVADMMRRTRAQYHHAVKYVHRECDNIRNDKMAEAIACNKKRNLWKEVHSMNNAKKQLPNVIDGEVGDKNIANIFFNKSKNLYNAVGFIDEKMVEISQKIDNKINESCLLAQNVGGKDLSSKKHFHNLNISELKTAIDDLKNDKKD